jgi:solute carrier family 25 phosphate transporter 23/24/25/41
MSQTQPKDQEDLPSTSERILSPPSPSVTPTPHTLEEFRAAEGREVRKRKLVRLWKALPQLLDSSKLPSVTGETGQISAEKAHSLKAMYDSELLIHCATPASGSRSHHIGWDEFKKYAAAKETGES